MTAAFITALVLLGIQCHETRRQRKLANRWEKIANRWEALYWKKP